MNPSFQHWMTLYTFHRQPRIQDYTIIFSSINFLEMWFWFYQFWFCLDFWMLMLMMKCFCYAVNSSICIQSNTCHKHSFIYCFFAVWSFVNAVGLSLWLGICMLNSYISCQLLQSVIAWFLSHQMHSNASVPQWYCYL